MRSRSDTGLWTRVVGILTAPRATFAEAAAYPRSLAVTLLVVVVAASCTLAFRVTQVGQLAALDRQVRQIESVGIEMTDHLYERLESTQPQLIGLSLAGIVLGWPLLWILLAVVLKAAYDRGGPTPARFRQVYAVVAHASLVFAVRAVVALPLDYARESIGGATSLGILLPTFGAETFAARLTGALDLFVLWWIALLAVGLGVLYSRTPWAIARRLLFFYVVWVLVLALAQTLAA